MMILFGYLRLRILTLSLTYVDPVENDDMLFEDGINTAVEAERDSSTAIPKSIGLNLHHVKRNLHLLENVVSSKIFHQAFPV